VRVKRKPKNTQDVDQDTEDEELDAGVLFRNKEDLNYQDITWKKIQFTAVGQEITRSIDLAKDRASLLQQQLLNINEGREDEIKKAKYET